MEIYELTTWKTGQTPYTTTHQIPSDDTFAQVEFLHAVDALEKVYGFIVLLHKAS